MPRGHSRSTRTRAPSPQAGGSYARLIWIIGRLLLECGPPAGHRLPIPGPGRRRRAVGASLADAWIARWASARDAILEVGATMKKQILFLAANPAGTTVL